MVVLSLFDGMSCGQIALRQLGIVPEVYYASEIDTHAIRQTQLNFPDTIQLGDVTGLDVSSLRPVDLLIGGSPCQSFSFAGKRNGMSTTDQEEVCTLQHYLELKSKGFMFEGGVLPVLGVYAYPDGHTHIQSQCAVLAGKCGNGQ